MSTQQAPGGEAALSTAQLAQRTGVAAATLRIWEARHGFPAPGRRAGGGHRRYSELDVVRVLTVLARRAEGLSLAAAIARTIDGEESRPASIFAGLASRRPDLRPMTLPKDALLRISHALEDEHCAHGGEGALVGSFQTAAFYRRSERRWRALARTARVAVALADFPRARRPRDGAFEVPVRREHALAREWVVAFHSRSSSGCLAAWEIPSARDLPDGERLFEALWSPEPEVAHAALSVAHALIEPIAPDAGRALREALEQPAPSSPELRAAVGQAHRLVTYIGAAQ